MERETTIKHNDRQNQSRKRITHPRTFRQWPFRGVFLAIAAHLSRIEGTYIADGTVRQRYYRGNPTVVRMVHAEIERRRRRTEGVGDVR